MAVEGGTNDDIVEFLVRASGTAGSVDHQFLRPPEQGLSPRTASYSMKKQAKVPWYKQKPDIKLVIAAVLLAIIIILAVILECLYKPSEKQNLLVKSTSPTTKLYRFASVAADYGPCSEVGTSILARGGTAVDAAIAALTCGTAVHMQSAGIGGGFFMVVWDARTQKAFTIDARETAPLSFTEDLLAQQPSLFRGKYSVGVPGEVAGLWAAHQRFGRLPWYSLFQPAIEICKKGFKVTKALTGAFEGYKRFTTGESSVDNLRTFMTNPTTGAFYREGETMHCPPKFLHTLERIAINGSHEFYNGSLADDIIADLKDNDVPITKEDLASYQPVWREPLVSELKKDTKIYSMRPPGSGAIFSYFLNILRGYNFAPADVEKPLSYHRMVEAMKFAYAQRTLLGDESFSVPEGEVAALVANISNPDFGEATRKLINDSKVHPLSYYGPNTFDPNKDYGTAQISVLAGDGSAVSLTSTINLIFGSGILGSRTGIIFNNEMDDFFAPWKNTTFGRPPNAQNYIRPGKRPMSSMCPAIVVANNTVSLVIGAAGGSRITAAAANVAARVLLFGENVKQAIEATRLFHQRAPEKLIYEPNAPPSLIKYLRDQGHVNVEESVSFLRSIVQGVQRFANGSIIGVSDARKGGLYADGF